MFCFELIVLASGRVTFRLYFPIFLFFYLLSFFLCEVGIASGMLLVDFRTVPISYDRIESCAVSACSAWRSQFSLPLDLVSIIIFRFCFSFNLVLSFLGEVNVASGELLLVIRAAPI